MVILVITLVVVALAGPVAGYFFARRRGVGRPKDSDLRMRQLEDEIRRHRSVPAWAGQQTPAPAAPSIPVPPPGPGVSQSGGPGNGPQQYAQGPAQPGPEHQGVHQGSVSHASRSGAERFAQEPPLFRDDVAAQQRSSQPTIPSQVPHIPAARPPQPVVPSPAPPAQDPAPSAAPVQPSAPAEPTGPPVPAAATPQPGLGAPAVSPKDAPSSPALGGDGAKATETPVPTGFRSVSDLIDDSEAQKLDWLSSLTTGRRVRLQKLGYDVPEKLANLRRAEVRRLARELEVAEDVIRDQWMPAAAEQLKSKGKL
jgi:predicted flap endonuclease-1-like 5' DNA nuclease